MILFPNAAITIYNKFYDNTLERDCYKRTVIENVDWQEKQEGSIKEKGLVLDSSIKIFIDKLDNYISPKAFRRLGAEERENYFTLDIGDLIVKGDIDFEINSTKDILAKRKLQDGGPAQQLFTKECALCFNNYVPFKSGTLKDLDVKINVDNIVYYAPYARKQYYENKGNGKGGVNRSGQRGRFWDKRGFADHKDEIINKVADFVGGKV